MRILSRLSVVEQVATHLREEIFSGALASPLPGVHALAALLGVNHKTVEGALRRL